MCKQECFAIVRNIPKSFHSHDLRTFFSTSIEEHAFLCFHFKHRPEFVKDKNSVGQVASNKQTNICIVKFIDETKCQHVIDLYNGKNWIDSKGNYLREKCVIVKFILASNMGRLQQPSLYLTRREQALRKRHADDQSFSAADLSRLSELKPPVNVMPNGNVGTSISVFQNLIKQCVLPSSVIKSLGLSLTTSASNRRYGNVSFDYEESGKSSSKPKTSEKAQTTGDMEILTSIDSDNLRVNDDAKQESTMSVEELVESETNEDDSDSDDGEEWDRHEAFHDDVTSQERSKERLFEEKIELKWEKGGSGLVFYTDAQYWAEEQGDFDEQTTDDWDVDMSIYYGEEGDKDAKDFVQMRKEQRLRRGLDVTALPSTRKLKKIEFSSKRKNIGEFEKHTKGFGRKIMEKMGWDDSQTLGRQAEKGLLEPLEAEGQSSREKTGFGYHGEKLNRNPNVVLKSSAKRSNAASASSDNSSSKTSRLIKLDQTWTSNFPQHKIVEPHASHSWIFPQFRSNLVSLYDRHRSMTPEKRAKFVPGKEGVAITTVFDEPLEIDKDPGLLRSQHPTSLKRRMVKLGDERKVSDHIIPVTSGSKLVKSSRSHANEKSEDWKPTGTSASSYFNSTLSYSSLKFVRPEDPAEHFV